MTFADAAVRLAGATGWLLGWRPAEFWRETPAELAAIVGAMTGAAPSAPVDLAGLMERFPDG